MWDTGCLYQWWKVESVGNLTTTYESNYENIFYRKAEMKERFDLRTPIIYVGSKRKFRENRKGRSNFGTKLVVSSVVRVQILAKARHDNLFLEIIPHNNGIHGVKWQKIRQFYCGLQLTNQKRRFYSGVERIEIHWLSSGKTTIPTILVCIIYYILLTSKDYIE